MRLRLPIAALPSAAALAVLAACTRDLPTNPNRTGELAASHAGEDKVVVCHKPDAEANPIEVSTAALAAHEAHGDHVARFLVDNASAAAGDGIHFSRITDAIAAARAIRIARGEQHSAACRITIDVAAGVYRGAVGATTDPTLEHFPLVLDVPDVTLRGALVMQLDERGRATGASATGAVTTLAPTTGLLYEPLPEVVIALNGHPGGFAGDGATIEGFAVRSGHVGVDDLDAGGIALLSLRVTGVTVRGNRFEPGFISAIDLRASSALVEQNSTSGDIVCDFCLSGPGTYTARGNRITKGGIDGFSINPVAVITIPSFMEPYVLPASSELTATVSNNYVRDHLRKPVGVAIRVETMGLNAPNVPASSHVEVRDNELVNNQFALLYEAGFPVANTLLKGDLTLTMSGNAISRSCQKDLLVSFTRHAKSLGVGQLTRPYLKNSNYDITLGGDLSWADDVWYDHPAGFGNTLVVNGAVIPNGKVTAYDAARVCAPDA